MPTTLVIVTIRPQRAFIIPRSTPRASRKDEVRFTSMTCAHSSSDIRMNRLSRVMPALLTRMSTDPIASAACFDSASTVAGSPRFAVTTCARSPRLSASSRSGASRVPDRATLAPAACNAEATAPPIPPEAPVISAVFPVRSNISASSCLEISRGSGAAPLPVLSP